MSWVLDLDGVLWLADQPLPGAAEAVGRLRAAGRRVIFLTNNSSLTVAEYLDKLAGVGVPAVGPDLVTSAQAAASLVEPGERALVCAGQGVVESLAQRGATPTELPPADVVVVGLLRSFDYGRLAAATSALLGGARLIGTNDDATLPTPDGPLPGAGSLLAAVAYASGVTPTVAGKPYQPIADLLAHRVGGPVELMVGDRPSTDGLFARRLGTRFGLVRSGVTKPGVPAPDPAPDFDASDLAELVDQILSMRK
jgi:HAD superfamily hydrolase (TIGR01450 family)